MDRKIIHVDMDAFFASVESRDHPELAGKPLIIGALPQERGVVSTCSYEARKYGVRSAMNIKEAYRRCPQGIYMHPDIRKYREVSAQLHEIWGTYTDVMEYISLDEGYLDVTGSIRLFGSARNIGQMIRERTRKEVGLTCSVGIGYSKATAKFASEEKKPNGFFEIPDQEFFRELIKKRKIEVLLGVGNRSSEKLHEMHIYTVQDLLENQKLFGLQKKYGSGIIKTAAELEAETKIRMKAEKKTPHRF